MLSSQSEVLQIVFALSYPSLFTNPLNGGQSQCKQYPASDAAEVRGEFRNVVAVLLRDAHIAEWTRQLKHRGRVLPESRFRCKAGRAEHRCHPELWCQSLQFVHLIGKFTSSNDWDQMVCEAFSLLCQNLTKTWRAFNSQSASPVGFAGLLEKGTY